MLTLCPATFLNLLLLTVIWWNLWFSVYKIMLSVTRQFYFTVWTPLCPVQLLWLVFQYGITRSGETGPIVLFLVLEEILSAFHWGTMLSVVGLSYQHIMSTCSFYTHFVEFLLWKDVECFQVLLWISWDMIFILRFVNVVYHIHWFVLNHPCNAEITKVLQVLVLFCHAYQGHVTLLPWRESEVPDASLFQSFQPGFSCNISFHKKDEHLCLETLGTVRSTALREVSYTHWRLQAVDFKVNLTAVPFTFDHRFLSSCY